MFAFLCQQPMGKEILAFLCRHPEGKGVLVSLLQRSAIRQNILAFALQQPIKQNVLAPSLQGSEGKEMLAFLLQQPDAKEILASLRNFEESAEAKGLMGALVGNRSLIRFNVPYLYQDVFNDTLLEAVAKACPNLSHISLCNCDGITDVGLQTLAQSCPIS